MNDCFGKYIFIIGCGAGDDCFPILECGHNAVRGNLCNGLIGGSPYKACLFGGIIFDACYFGFEGECFALEDYGSVVV